MTLPHAGSSKIDPTSIFKMSSKARALVRVIELLALKFLRGVRIARGAGVLLTDPGHWRSDRHEFGCVECCCGS
jgi:hypothetical protein